MPRLYKEVISNAGKLGLQIISARTMFETEMPSNFFFRFYKLNIDGFKEWKIKTFLRISEKLDMNAVTNIVAIGDSQIEMDAAGHLAEYNFILFLHIKFRVF